MSKPPRVFWIIAIAGAVLTGEVAWFSARSQPRAHPSVTTGGRTPGERGSGESEEPAHRLTRDFGSSGEPPPVVASRVGDDQGTPSAGPLAAGDDESGRNVATDGTARPADTDETVTLEAPPSAARPTGQTTAVSASGEMRWSAKEALADAGASASVVCGGKVCRPGQFCCGPAACGRCAYPLAGPRCPSTCSGNPAMPGNDVSRNP